MRRVAEGSRFYYDGTQEIAEYTLDTFPLTNGTIKKRFIRLPGSVDAPFLMINYEAGNCTAGNSSNFTACERWIYQDERGSVVATSDTNGNIVETYHYSEYGEPTVTSGAEMPFGYTGQRYDQATGLYYYKARYYDADTGRFIQPDPIGYGDGPNIYGYVGGNPINFSDPTGLYCASRIEGNVGCAGIPNRPTDRTSDGFVDGNGGGSGSSTPCDPTQTVCISTPDCIYTCNALDDVSTSILGSPIDTLAINIDVDPLQLAGSGNVGLGIQALSLGLDALAVASLGADLLLAGPTGEGVLAAGAVYGIKNQLRQNALNGLIFDQTTRLLYGSQIGSRGRINSGLFGRYPDGLTSTTLSEIKFLSRGRKLSYTRQLRAYSNFARRNNLRFDLYVPPYARLTRPLQRQTGSGYNGTIRVIRVGSPTFTF